ncbi:TonB-dependent receptor domain-containing protein [Chitinophaga rhizosphaerae]|uniref:TonB-dependent receptor domain-containing protein n=1 Tax=Chitinophaga rhizosphaerae TaxID=1864947 RepID=UPI000F7FC171|nr:TonB-dependent receptor [Chitinophaga rhizosphaerae]
MQLRSILTVLILIVCTSVSFAQRNIYLKVTDAGGNPLPFASVVVKKAADSSLVKGQMSDTDGKIQFESVNPGKYFIEASQMGFTTARTAAFQLQEKNVELKALVLQAAPKSLKGVEVTAQKPFIERAEGKTVLNVEGSVAAAGNSVLDLLRRAPGVTVDKDDNLVLKGKQGVTVMIDGKLTYLSNDALAELLKSMNAEGVSAIEIITSPGAKYDAAGSSGIINIKTKKGQLTGFNGSVSLSGGNGRYMYYSTGVTLNWRTKKFNAFGNFNIGDRQGFNTRELNRKTGGDEPLHYHQSVFQKNDFLNRSGKIGFDWFLDDKQTIGVMANGYTNAFWRSAPSATEIRRPGMDIDSVLYSDVSGNNRFRGISTNLNYKLKIDTLGSELSMDADYAKFYNRMHTYLSDSMRREADHQILNQSALRTLPFTHITIRSIKADWVQALNKSTKLEAGAKGSFVETDNNMAYDSMVGGGYKPVYSQYDQFIYRENVLAGYATLKKNWKKLDMTAGLRVEHTSSDANSISLKNRIKRNYTDFFPNFTVDYKISDDHKVGATYNKRINRPGYGQLNPFMFFLDKYTFFRGNAYLTPEYTHNTELSYTFKNKYIFSAGYSQTNDVIDEYLILNEKSRVTTSTSRNLGTRKNISAEVTLPVDFTKWWNTNTNAAIFHNQYYIRDSLGDFSTKSLSWHFNSTHTFSLPKEIKIELSGWYEAPNVYGIWRSKAMWAANAGVQKTVMNKKGTLKVSVNDIFASARFRGTADFNNVYLDVNNRWQNRTLNVSFTYRFGNSKVEGARERKSGSEEESRRAG